MLLSREIYEVIDPLSNNDVRMRGRDGFSIVTQTDHY